jgi:Kelch motif/Galactose oxidase, central domain
MKNRHLPTLIAVVALVGAACGGAAPASQTATPTVALTAAAPTATPTPAPSPSTPTGQMTRGRSDHTATALVDGRVLIAGGYNDGFTMASANLFDPGTNVFSATSPLAHARAYHTATRLPNGRVLVVGGTPRDWTFEGPFLASAELYDPTTGTFSATGSLATARNEHTATLLLDGRVLIAGGNDAEAHSVASAELYDPKSGTFGATGAMGVARGFHTATLLADGRVLITGGCPTGWNGPFVASAEIYDPKTGRFSTTGSMHVARVSHTATLLANGQVLITGGTADGTTSLASAELFNPKTGKFTATGPMTTGRTFHEATLLLDGRVLLTAGDPDGWVYHGPFLGSAEIYDPKTGTFAATGPMIEKVTSQSATLLADGRVLIAGGADGSGDTAGAEIFDPATGTFTPTGPGS